MIANGRLPWEVSVTSRREPLSRASTRHGHFCFSLTLSGGSCGGQSLPHEGVAGDRRAPGQGKTFPFWLPKRSEEHTSELQSLMRISYAVFCLKKKNNKNTKMPYETQGTATETIALKI